jgi:uncharacterized protein (DUF486 family)
MFLFSTKTTHASCSFIYQNLSHILRTVLLLICSNIFMTFAWYGNLKYAGSWPLWKIILVSWGIAFFEYCFLNTVL